MTALPSTSLDRAQALLVERLEAAFDGDPGARIFLQAALRSARRGALPTDPEAILDFARAHLLGPLTEELGGRAVAAFLDDLTRALRTPVSDVEVSADVELDDESLGLESGEGLRPSRIPTALPPPPRDREASTLPPSKSVRSGPCGRPRTLLVHGDRLTRAILARQLVAAGCDVTVIETPTDLATVTEALPDFAVVDLAARGAQDLLRRIVARNPGLQVLGLVPPGCDASALFRAAGIGRHETISHAARAAVIAARLRELQR